MVKFYGHGWSLTWLSMVEDFISGLLVEPGFYITKKTDTTDTTNTTVFWFSASVILVVFPEDRQDWFLWTAHFDT